MMCSLIRQRLPGCLEWMLGGKGYKAVYISGHFFLSCKIYMYRMFTLYIRIYIYIYTSIYEFYLLYMFIFLNISKNMRTFLDEHIGWIVLFGGLGEVTYLYLTLYKP